MVYFQNKRSENNMHLSKPWGHWFFRYACNCNLCECWYKCANID